MYILVRYDNSKNIRAALSKSLAKILKNKNFKCIDDKSFHKLAKILNDGSSIAIKKIFTSINLRNVINCNDNELFNINYEIKKKIDTDNTFIKKEFNFDINECQHKYQKREGVTLNKKEINIYNLKKVKNVIKEEEKNIKKKSRKKKKI